MSDQVSRAADKLSTTTVVEARDLSKTLPLGSRPVTVLAGINFRIARGELVAILGPSGSGKSTLLGIIAGLDSPTSGHILIDGIDITRMDEDRLAHLRNRRIGMVFQMYNLISSLTAQENVELPLYLRRHQSGAAKQAKDMLSLVGMSHRLDRRPDQLSGGEQQRVAIARALVAAPALVVMDEPTGNLDRANGDMVLALTRDLGAQTGATFIIATHDPAIARSADRTIPIVDGKVDQQAIQQHE